MENYTGLEIAVIGLAGRFPGANSVAELWDILVQGKESVSCFTKEELISHGVSPELARNPAYVPARGILENAGYFDNSFFGFSAREAALLDPQLRVFFECVYEALEDAAYAPLDYPGKIGLFAGANPNLYWSMASYLSGVEDIGDFANKDLLTTRISYKLNLRGPSQTLFTACSTSLVAIHEACRSLLSGDCDIALAGGVSIELPQVSGYLHREGMILSVDGHNRSFDKLSSGTVFSNGAGAVVLKPLDSATRDRDHVYAVVKGSAVNNDGNRKVSFPAPSVKGQAEVIREAMLVAQVEPGSVSYIEAHGSATTIGDPIEIEALTQAFDLPATQQCGIGSVKTNIGHLNVASGIAGFIKTVLALQNEIIPPNIHYTEPNPKIQFSKSPFYVVRENTPWKTHKEPRRAGVSSFGVGGTNAHAILEEAPKIAVTSPIEGPSLFIFSAKTVISLKSYEKKMLSFLRENNSSLADITYTLQVGRSTFATRDFFVCQSREEAIEKLSKRDHVQQTNPEESAHTLVFRFSGLREEPADSGLTLYHQNEFFRSEADKGFRILSELLGENIGNIPVGQQDSHAWPAMKNYGAPVVFVLEYALYKFLHHIGVQPDVVTGSGYGEYSAACATEILTFRDAICLVIAHSAAKKLEQAGQSNGSVQDNFNHLCQVASTVKTSLPRVPYISSFSGKILSNDELSNTSYWTTRSPYDPAEPDFAENEIAKLNNPICVAISGESCAAADLDGNGFYLLNTLGLLWSKGVAVNWDNFYGKENTRHRVSLPAYCFDRKLFWFNEEIFSKKSAALLQTEDGPTDDIQLYQRDWVNELPLISGNTKQSITTILFRGDDIIGIDLQEELGKTYTSPLITVRAGKEFKKVGEFEFCLDPFDQTSIETFLNMTGVNDAPLDLIFCGFWESFAGKKADLEPGLFQQDMDVLTVTFLNIFKAFKPRRNEICRNVYYVTRKSADIECAPNTSLVNTFLFGACQYLKKTLCNYSFKRVELDFDGQLSNDSWHRKRIKQLADEMSCTDHPFVFLKADERLTLEFVQKTRKLFKQEEKKTNERIILIGHISQRMLRLAEHYSRSGNTVDILSRSDFPDQEFWTLWESEEKNPPHLPGMPDAFGDDSGLAVSLANTLAEEFEADQDVLVRTPKLENFMEVASQLEAALICAYFEECGLFLIKDKEWKQADVFTHLGDVKFIKFYFYFLHVLKLHEIIDYGLERLVVLKTHDAADMVKRLRIVINRSFPEGLALLNLVEHCVNHYRKVFSGEISGVSVLFPEGNSALLDAFSHNQSISSTIPFYADRVKRLLSQYLQHLNFNAKIRILEVGAGRGELTRAILPELKGWKVEYYFTDIGRSFLQEGKKQFSAEYDFIEYKVFDINQDPASQGLDVFSFDIVLALDVVHATPYLEKTIANLSCCLKPGGWMLLIENTSSVGLSNMVWGLAEGWWDFKDEHLRRITPLLPPDEWVTFLNNMDFEFVASIKAFREDIYNDHALIAVQTKAAGQNELYTRHLKKLNAIASTVVKQNINSLRSITTNPKIRFYDKSKDQDLCLELNHIVSGNGTIDQLIYCLDEQDSNLNDIFALRDFVARNQYTGRCAIILSQVPPGDQNKSLAIAAAQASVTGLVNLFNCSTEGRWISVKCPADLVQSMQLLDCVLSKAQSGDWVIADADPWAHEIPEVVAGKANQEQLEGNAHDATLFKVCEIWNELFNIDNTSEKDDYFELGGDSLMMVTMLSRIEKEFRVKIKINEFYENTSISSLTQLIISRTPRPSLQIRKAEKKEYYPATSAQKTMFYMQMLHPESTAYNITKIIELQHHVLEERITTCLNLILQRQINLQTTFRIIKGEPCQLVLEEFRLQPEYFSIQAHDITKTTEKFIKPFDLTDLPPIRIAFADTGTRRFMLIDIHHIICDGISIDILKNELNALYYDMGLKGLDFQYMDFADWQTKAAFRNHIKSQEEYWMKIFSEPVKKATIASDYVIPEYDVHQGSHLIRLIDQDFSQRILTFTRSSGTTLFTHLLASAFILLSKYSSSDNIVIGTGTKGRNFQGLDQIIGNFVNTVALRCFPRQDMTYQQFLKQVELTIGGALENQDYQYEELISKLPFNQGKRDKSLFNVAITLVSGSLVNQAESPERRLFKDYVEYFDNTSKFNIDINAVEKSGAITLVIEYSSSLYRSSTIEAFLNNYTQIIEAVTADPQILLAEIPFLYPRQIKRAETSISTK